MKATEYIKSRLKDKGLNVERMSEVMGISIPTAYKYVREPETMTLKMARKKSPFGILQTNWTWKFSPTW